MRSKPPYTGNRRGGMALVIVLSFLMLITILVMAFFSSVSSEFVGAKTTSDTLTARSLANSATEIVKGVIQQATKQGPDYAWASQPGMIRTYDNSGNPYNFFKLYSAETMVLPSSQAASFDPADDLDPKWEDNPALFTDLNSPILEPDPANPTDFRTVFPIIDPRARASNPNDPTDGVAGFNFTAEYGGVVSQGDDARVPMPVHWIYVLRDGTLAPPQSAGGTKVKFSTNTPTGSNPIVGRIAFWTDDETCKVNINTASEGAYWDTPRINSPEDRGEGTPQAGVSAITPGLALCQPANREFQRYPGHPAMTCLSPIFAGLFFHNDPNRAGITRANASQLDPYYSLAPRIVNDSYSSNGGTRVPQLGMTPDGDRFYTSIDELVFAPNRTANPPGNGLTEDALEKARFFITAHSNAPEVTLFNTPRISMWPVWDNQALRTAYDKLAAFCGTIKTEQGDKEYYFKRKNSRSVSDDIDGIKRNQELYGYLQDLTARSVPGFGGKFSDKYPTANGVSERDQILTEIFDYIRCVNLRDPTTGATPYTVAPAPWTNTDPDKFATSAGSGEVLPIRIGKTQGFGRFDSVCELAFLFYGTAVTKSQNPAEGGKEFTTSMRMIPILQYASPMQGNIGYQPNLRYRITGLDGLTVTVGSHSDLPLQLPPGGSNLIEVGDNQTHDGRSQGGIEGPGMAFVTGHWDTANSKKLNWGVDSDRSNHAYPWFSQNDVSWTLPPFNPRGVTLPSPTTFTLSSGKITVTVEAADTGQTIQTLVFDVPQTAEIKLPDFDPAISDFQGRLDRVGVGNAWRIYGLVEGADTVVSLQVAGPSDDSAGDIRMIAGRETVDDPKYFKPADNWNNAKGKAHSLMTSLGAAYNGATFSPLVAGANYQGGGIRQPGLPSRVKNGVKRADGGPGDWDTGIGAQKDGAYINKPDEGDQEFKDLVGGGTRVPYFQKDDHFVATDSIFSPNRQIPSSMMLGGIPTGVQRFLPWQTLLFCPKPEDSSHPGLKEPKDHLLADLFWMPIVEPYAISEPLSTLGKVNMNYQLIPFGANDYIVRSTAMQAVMKSTKFMALQVSDAKDYKPHIGWGGDPGKPTVPNRRFTIDPSKTLAAFDQKFANKDIFRSATQICEIDLVPPAGGSMASFWGTTNKLTGDNLREKPYADLYGRLTTKSNSFTVHIRAQALKQAIPAGTGVSDPQWKTWDESKDQVLGDYRGSSIIERYIDPRVAVVDFARSSSSRSPADINVSYRFRTSATKQFGQ